MLRPSATSSAAQEIEMPRGTRRHMDRPVCSAGFWVRVRVWVRVKAGVKVWSCRVGVRFVDRT